MAQTLYVTELATVYLKRHKFRDWSVHSNTGLPVSEQDREQRAREVAETLCSHQQWKMHTHGISRDVAWEVVKLRIEHPDKVEGFQRALRRLWALLYWMFDRGAVAKVFLGQRFSLFRSVQQIQVPMPLQVHPPGGQP